MALAAAVMVWTSSRHKESMEEEEGEGGMISLMSERVNE